ncbi:MAG: hypothetical protein VW268_05685 [Rhodospirillaceae bacterium]
MAILLLLPGLPAAAEDGRLTAVSSTPLPAGKPFAVRPLDDSDEALKLKSLFEQELVAHRHRIDPKSDVVLTFEIIDEVGAYSVTDRRYFIELKAQGSRTGGEDAQARFNVFDSNSGGILNKGSGGTKIVTPSKYRLKVTIDGPAGPGRLARFWQGMASGNLGTANNEKLVRAMVVPLVRSIGKTVKGENFPLPD